MSTPSEPAPTLPLSPCIGICRLDGHGYCVGCQRTGEEIGRWSTLSDSERLHVMRVILPARRTS
ncbi:MAG: DUF1289 domain-containing protein [Rhodanobacter sp.]